MFKEDRCKEEEPCNAGRLQALPSNEGRDTPPPKENSDSVGQHLCGFPVRNKAGHRGQDWERFWGRSGCITSYSETGIKESAGSAGVERNLIHKFMRTVTSGEKARLGGGVVQALSLACNVHI